jgi:hypothetical protein
MAVSPLESRGDTQTQDFISGKSDIKMVEFGSTGVAAVYADVAPYRETPLYAGPLVDMGDEENLIASLQDVYSNSDRWRVQASQSVAAHRMANDVVGRTWFRAIQNVRLDVPFELANLLDRYNQFSKFSREWATPKELFNEDDYLAQNKDLRPLISNGKRTAYEHYVTEGLAAGRVWFPGSLANAQELMLRVREDVLKEDQAIKALEKRVANAVKTPALESEEVAPAVELVERAPFWSRLRLTMRKVALKCGLEKHPPLFDPGYYLKEYPDVRDSGMDPYLHYVLHGISEKRNPNRYFNTWWYLERNPDANRDGVDPLDHYLREGTRRGLDPSAEFSTQSYLERHPGLKKSGMNPLQHFLIERSRREKSVARQA